MNPLIMKAAIKKIIRLAIKAGVADLVAQTAKTGIKHMTERNKTKKSAASKRNEHAYKLALASYENTVEVLENKANLDEEEETALKISQKMLAALENYRYEVEGSFNAYHKKQLAILYTRYNGHQPPAKKEKKIISLFVGALSALVMVSQTAKQTGLKLLKKPKNK